MAVALGRSPQRETRGGEYLPPANLLRLHRGSLTNLLVFGGDSDQRLEVVRQFHHESPLRNGPLIRLSGRSDERGLLRALRAGLIDADPDAGDLPARIASCGTLFVDEVGDLSFEAQRLFLLFARGSASTVTWLDETRPFGRIAAGNPVDLAALVAEERFSAPLLDMLDKLRIELSPARMKGAA